MANITFRLKGYDKGDVNLFLNTTNPPHETNVHFRTPSFL